MDVISKVQALQPLASLLGEILTENDNVVRVRAAGAILEIPRQHIAEKREREGVAELVLTKDAVVVVSTVVSAKKGFIADDVFGALGSVLAGDNCNCNCNCNGGNCNCNCNCDCTDCSNCTDCSRGSFLEASGAGASVGTVAARRFRGFPGGGEKNR